MKIICETINDLNTVAEKLLNAFPDERVFAFYGAMGVGKTTLIKQICSILSVPDITKSPSFSIVNEYIADNPPAFVKSGLSSVDCRQLTIYHFDFYRINKQEEAFDIGFEEYLYSGNYCFIEWSEKVENLLPDKYIKIFIEETDNQQRSINYELIINY